MTTHLLKTRTSLAPFAACLIAAFTVFMAALTVAVLPARADVYTDTQFDNFDGDSSDIANVEITNDGTNITFKTTTNPFANLGVNYFNNYEYGIQVGGGAGGQTLINGSFGLTTANGNPYGNSVGISTGVNYWIGNFLGNPGPIGAYPAAPKYSVFRLRPVGQRSALPDQSRKCSQELLPPASRYHLPI